MVDEKEKKDFQSLVGKLEDRVELKGTRQEIDNTLAGIEQVDPELEYPNGLSKATTDTTIEVTNKNLKAGFHGDTRSP